MVAECSHCFVSSPGFWPAGDANLVTSLLQVRKRLSGELDLELLRAFSRAPSPVCQEFSSVFTCVVFLSISSLSPRLGLCMVLFSARTSTERLFLANTLTHLNLHNPALSPSLSSNAFVYIGGDRLYFLASVVEMNGQFLHFPHTNCSCVWAINS